MEIYGFISENRNKIESAYDLAALCYDYLMTQIQSNKQTVFIAEYIDFPEETDDEETHVPKGNPNIEMLRKFTDDVFYTLLKDYLDMDVLLDDILDFVSSAKHHLQNYGNEAYNKAAIAYYLLMAINLYAGNCTKSSDPAPPKSELPNQCLYLSLSGRWYDGDKFDVTESRGSNFAHGNQK